ncbi:hypothetical protein ABB07_36625 [Streptomyces incarnatus]|uniref:Uncharacterized protein n=1 Tax=Streptomyces incarnatus TaxID=665007 RepID=A0ABN4GUA0_9ACTN|nr:hypothetical protein [Streptomyces incarnatus]AKJ15393.1 hypothetical protein ABB07_36625 [Streptomyces incarnatus]
MVAWSTEASRAHLESYLHASAPYDEIRILLFTLSKIRTRPPLPLPLNAADAVSALTGREGIVWRPLP